MASINAFIPSFLLNCMTRQKAETRQPIASAQQGSPRHTCDAVAMAAGDLNELYKGATSARRTILQSQDLKEHYDKLAHGQSPKYYVIACSDSRVSPPRIFGVRPGDIFGMQQLGALMPALPQAPARLGEYIDSEWANVSFAVRELKVQHLIVLGHTGCGALAGIMNPEAISHNAEVAAHLDKHSDLRQRVDARFRGLSKNEKALAAVGESVLATMEKVHEFAPVKAAVEAGALQVHAMVYEIANHGAVSVWDAALQEFVIQNAEKKDDHSILPRRQNTGNIA